MARTSVFLLTFLTAIRSVAAQEVGDSPVFTSPGLAPTICVAEGIEASSLKLRLTVTENVVKTRTRTFVEKVLNNGHEESVTKQVQEAYQAADLRSVISTYPLADVKVFDSDGRPIPAAKYAELFAQPSVVLYALRGAGVDPAYLRIAQKGTLFVSIRQAPEPLVAP